MSALTGFVMRDAAIVAGTLALWQLEARLAGAGTIAATAAAVGAGVMTAVSGFVLHEWGHLLGALWAHGQVQISSRPWVVFLFHFDVARNSREQFLAMSCGGFAASALAIAALLLVLPFEGLAARVAWSLTGLGVLATALFEIPPAWRVFRTAPQTAGLQR